MPTVLDIATEAEVAPEHVLRVVNGEAVSAEVEGRVRSAMQALGRPTYPQPLLPEPVRPAAVGGEDRDAVLERLARAASELESSLPLHMGSVVYEALRVEVRPVAEHVAGLQALFETLVSELRRLRLEVEAERRDRVEDLALQVELLRASWVGVDRRLGRIERSLARADQAGQQRTALSTMDLRPVEVVPAREGNGSEANGAGAAAHARGGHAE